MSIISTIGIFLILSIVITNNIVTTNGINNAPIIGILAQETPRYHHLMANSTSYIAASYVKFIEGAGGRVVPIRIGKNKDYYRDILGKINGVLWPGGGADFNKKNGYASAGKEIYKIAKKMNNESTHFPILGICLGMELLTTYVKTDEFKKINCSSQEQALPLTFTSNVGNSKLFANADSEIIDILRNEKVTINFHRYCVIKKTANKKEDYRIISENRDKNDKLFISSLEHKKYPFYGFQFHPEKNIYEWVKGKNIPHTSNAIKVSQYFANFFVNEARKNRNKFSDRKEEAKELIYNYSPFYTGKNHDSSFQQIYLLE